MRLLFLALLFVSSSVMSHQTSRTSALKEIKWGYTTIPVYLSNESRTLGNAEQILNQSLQEWSQVSNFNLVPVGSGSNQVRFLDDFSKYGSRVVGLTEVSYTPAGSINSATVYLNEENYRFVSTPGPSSMGQVYLKDVLTHELGHFLGMAHSEVLDSTMFYQTFPGQSELGADDKAGVRSKYVTGFGKISGFAKGGRHIGILGVHVQAISRKTGQAISSISDPTGYFEIGGLDLEDTYYLYSAPLQNLNSLGSYLSNTQTEFCPGAYVPSFFSKCGRDFDGIAQGVTLTASRPTVAVGEVTINCTLRVPGDYIQQKLKPLFGEMELFNFGEEPRFEKTHIGYFNLNELTETFSGFEKYSINLTDLAETTGKRLKIRLVSQPFGNPVEFQMVVRKNHYSVAGSPYYKTLKAEGTYNLDLEAEDLLDADPQNNLFQIELSAKTLTTDQTKISIPDVLNFAPKQSLPYLLIMSVEENNQPLLNTGVVLSDNSTCLDAPFSYAVQNSTAKSDETSAKAKTAGGAIAGCGTIEPPSGPGPGSFFGLVSLGFLLSFLISGLAKRQKNFLS